MRIASVLLLSLFGELCAVMPVHAAEGFANCTGFITLLPATISNPGTWCLKQNLSTANTTGNAITINANDAVLDCNEFQIKGNAGLNGTSVGIKSINRFHDTVRHCNVQGFQQGLSFDITNAGPGPYGGHVVEDNRFEGNTGAGIYVEGNGSVVRRNLVFNTGGSTGAAWIPPGVHGIATSGLVSISNNTISSVTNFSDSTVIGIDSSTSYYTSNATGGSIDHNRVRQVIAPQSNMYGIYNTVDNAANGNGAGPITMTDNDVLGKYDLSSSRPVGLYCAPWTPPHPVLAQASRNIIAGFYTGLSACANGGKNDITP